MSARTLVKDIELIVRFAADLPEYFEGDETRLRQVIANLVGNSVKFTETGHVLIEVTGVSNGADGCNILVAVKDTGIGIEADKVANMFGKLEQADGSSTRKYQGTGLGLSISKSLVELMDGEIGAQSDLGVGSEFWFRVDLPLAEEGSVAPTAHTENLDGLRGLIVDDNAINRRIILELANKWGIEMDEAESAYDVARPLARMRQAGEMYDFILTDFNMPKVNGVMFAERVKRIAYFEQTPIIMLSSIGERDSDDPNTDRLFSDWLVKPARASQLVESIANAVRDRQLGELRTLAASEALRGAPATPDPCTNRLCILLAEDNVVNQLVVTNMLGQSPYEIIIAENGEMVVALFEERNPDLILMDISMPVMNGHEASRRIRDLETERGLKRTPIIGVTAHAMEGDCDACLQSGMDDYIPKPVEIQSLTQAVRKWLAAPQEDVA